MRRQITRLALVLATAFLAGCVNDPFVPMNADGTHASTDSSAPDAHEYEPTSTPAEEPSPMTRKPAPISDESDAGAEDRASPTMTSIDVAFHGRTVGRVCRGSPYDPGFACVKISPGDNTTFVLDGVARPVLLQGVLTWNASTYSNGHLVVHMMIHNGKDYVYSEGGWARTVGESPLSVSFNLAKYGGQRLALAISSDECILETAMAFNCAFAGAALIDVPQDFSFRGELTGWALPDDA